MKPVAVLVGPERRPAVVIDLANDVDVAWILVRAKPEAGEEVGRIRLATTQSSRLEVVPKIIAYGGSGDAVEVFLAVEGYIADQAAKAAKEGEK